MTSRSDAAKRRRRSARWVCQALVSLLVAGAGCVGPVPTSQPADRTGESAAHPSGPQEGRPPSRADEPNSRDDVPADEEADPSTLPGRVHCVQRGETLYSITRQYYGDEKHWRKVLVANRNRLRDPNNLRVGMKLIIP
ncbi:MAG: LysM peptidoglycan-binding domain-containing protein [Phycisphaerae bacterium]|nr:LysM peptidoglycan-binding domain-containing protein [Phycisphaerae bacterium]